MIHSFRNIGLVESLTSLVPGGIPSYGQLVIDHRRLDQASLHEISSLARLLPLNFGFHFSLISTRGPMVRNPDGIKGNWSDRGRVQINVLLLPH